MATIVQPYNSWREQLAANILGPIVGNFIGKAMERSQNANNTRALQSIMKAIDTQQQPQAQTNYLGLGAQPSNNGWQNAFRMGSNELANFDMNTANLAMPLGITATPRPRMSEADIQAAIINNAGNANISEVQKLMTPYIQARMKDDYISQLSDAKTWDDFMRTAIPANVAGVMSDNALGTTSSYAQFRQPHYTFSNVDAGDRQVTLSQNPLTGEVAASAIPIGINPNTLAELKTKYDIASMDNDTKKYGFDSTANVTMRGQDINERLETRKLDIEEEAKQYEREHPELEKVPGVDGRVYYVDKRTGKAVSAKTEDGQIITDQSAVKDIEIKQTADGSYVAINKKTATSQSVTDPSGNPVKGKSTDDDFRTKELYKKNLTRLVNEEKQINEDISSLNFQLSLIYDHNSSDYKSLQEQLAQKYKRLGEIQDVLNQDLPTLQGNNTPTQQPQSKSEPVALPFVSTDVSAQPKNTPQTGNVNDAGALQKVLRRNGMTFAIPTTQPEKSPAPTDEQAQIDKINGEITSRDASLAMPFVTPDVAPNVPNTVNPIAQPQSNSTKKPNIPAPLITTNDVPKVAFFTPSRDQAVKRDDIITLYQLGEIIDRLKAERPEIAKLSNTEIITRLYRGGIRIIPE